jgi:hypothetical protein
MQGNNPQKESNINPKRKKKKKKVIVPPPPRGLIHYIHFKVPNL